MKGAQLGATVGVLENVIGYLIAHVKNAPVMLLTAEAELANQRVEGHIIPMLQASGLESCIQSTDEGNKRKTGKTRQRISWYGGGSMIPAGAKNANKLRSHPIQFLLRDEIDAFEDDVGANGDPLKTSEARTNSYEATRKVGDVSTPLIKGTSKIARRFELGDQRRYYVRCLKCQHSQVIRWRRQNNDTGEVTGITWDTEDGRLVHGSVRYVCELCGHAHREEDKRKLISFENAEWKPTAKPSQPNFRSYHINALYSLFYSWEACVISWLQAWNEESNTVRDPYALQVFYNNILGEPYEIRGQKLKFENVSSHRRSDYSCGEIPNEFAKEFCLGPVLLVTCAVDVHKDNLAVATVGWCRDRRSFLIDYERLEGDTSQLDDPTTWVALQDYIENKWFIADDGAQYKIQLTLVDSGYAKDTVYQFCSQYQIGVYPIKGLGHNNKSAHIKHFMHLNTPLGNTAFGVTVDLYKDRWHNTLRQNWNGLDVQPPGHFNAPMNLTDKQLKELTVEVKREKIDTVTGRRIGHVWHRPDGVRNELWDLLVYNHAALDIIAWDYCKGALEAEMVSWAEFYQHALKDPETEQPMYFVPGGVK